MTNNPAKKVKVTAYSLPWVEKYRPLTLDQVVGNDETITRLQAIAEDGNMPNLILSGPPGTGKVSLWIVIQFVCLRDWIALLLILVRHSSGRLHPSTPSPDNFWVTITTNLLSSN